MLLHQDAGPPVRERERCSNNCNRNPGRLCHPPLSCRESSAESPFAVKMFDVCTSWDPQVTCAGCYMQLHKKKACLWADTYPTNSAANNRKAKYAAQSLARSVNRFTAFAARPRHTIEPLLLHTELSQHLRVSLTRPSLPCLQHCKGMHEYPSHERLPNRGSVDHSKPIVVELQARASA
jgi:hypothetical protein